MWWLYYYLNLFYLIGLGAFLATVPSTIFYSSIRLDPLEELQLLKVAGSFPFRRQITAM